MTGKQLRARRRQTHLSQVKFAALVGVTGNTVARWERDEVTMPPTTARLIDLLVPVTPTRRRPTR